MKAFRIAELAKPHGPVSRSKLFKDIADGLLIARKLGGATVILEDDWRRYLEGAPLALVARRKGEGHSGAPLAA